MSYALQTLLHEKARYAAGVGAVMFSAVLIALQVGLLLGLFEITSIPIDHTTADIWVGDNVVESVDLGRPIPVSYIGRLDKPGVQMPELYYLSFGSWTKRRSGQRHGAGPRRVCGRADAANAGSPFRNDDGCGR